MRGKRTTPTPKRLAQMLALDCGLATTLEEFMVNRVWENARMAAKRATMVCVHCGKRPHDSRLEVNHRVPVLGRHSEDGCHHHQDNLEVLCRPCHVKFTKWQHRTRQIGARRVKGGS